MPPSGGQVSSEKDSFLTCTERSRKRWWASPIVPDSALGACVPGQVLGEAPLSYSPISLQLSQHNAAPAWRHHQKGCTKVCCKYTDSTWTRHEEECIDAHGTIPGEISKNRKLRAHSTGELVSQEDVVLLSSPALSANT